MAHMEQNRADANPLSLAGGAIDASAVSAGLRKLHDGWGGSGYDVGDGTLLSAAELIDRLVTEVTGLRGHRDELQAEIDRLTAAGSIAATESGPDIERVASSLVGRVVEVVLERANNDHGEIVVIGTLLSFSDGGDVVVRDEDGFCHLCWPMLGIRAVL